MEILSSPIVIGGAAIVIAVLLAVMLFVKNWVKTPTNAVSVFSGRGQAQMVRGGGKFRMPGLVRVDTKTKLAIYPARLFL